MPARTEPLESSGPRESRISLRLRLTLWIVVISTVIQLTVGVVTLLYERIAVDRFFVARMEGRALSLVTDLAKSESDPNGSELERMALGRIPLLSEERHILTVYSPDGAVITSTREPALPMGDVLAGAEFTGRAASKRLKVPGLTDAIDRRPPVAMIFRFSNRSGAERVLVVAMTDRYASPVFDLVSSILLVTIPSGIIASGMAAWLIAGVAVRPIRELRNVAEFLAPETIDVPVPAQASSPSETADLLRNLEEVRTRLSAALHAQDRFISNVSHELKTPVAVLLTEAQTIDSRGLSPDQRRFIDSVTEEMRRLGRMVEGFLTLTRVRAGKAVVNVQRCVVNDVVMDSVSTCVTMAHQYSVNIVPELEESASLAVEGNAELLRIMIDNLLRNAIRFSPALQSVSIQLAEEGNEAVIRVCDTGAGIPCELMENLFNRFSQATNETNRGRGHGLGLAIAQGVAELHGGRISANNLDAGGCVFEVRLPAAPRLNSQ